MSRARESGQSAVETALTLPLALFMILGTLQLFLMMQARILTEYASYRAVRVGSTNRGDCRRMTHAAIAALLPAIKPFVDNADLGGNPGERLAEAFRLRAENEYAPSDGSTFQNTDIVWIYRESPTIPLPPGAAERFDDPDLPTAGAPHPFTLRIRTVFWFPLRIPFADWVMSRMFLANFQLRDYTAANPLLMARKAEGWTGNATLKDQHGGVTGYYAGQVNGGSYVFPIQATAALRMMTPPGGLDDDGQPRWSASNPNPLCPRNL